MKQATPSVPKHWANRFQSLNDLTRNDITWTRELSKAQLAALDAKQTQQLANMQNQTSAQLNALDATNAARTMAVAGKLDSNQHLTEAKLAALQTTTADKLDRNREAAAIHMGAVRDVMSAKLEALNANRYRPCHPDRR